MCFVSTQNIAAGFAPNLELCDASDVLHAGFIELSAASAGDEPAQWRGQWLTAYSDGRVLSHAALHRAAEHVWRFKKAAAASATPTAPADGVVVRRASPFVLELIVPSSAPAPAPAPAASTASSVVNTSTGSTSSLFVRSKDIQSIDAWNRVSSAFLALALGWLIHHTNPLILTFTCVMCHASCVMSCAGSELSVGRSRCAPLSTDESDASACSGRRHSGRCTPALCLSTACAANVSGVQTTGMLILLLRYGFMDLCAKRVISMFVWCRNRTACFVERWQSCLWIGSRRWSVWSAGAQLCARLWLRRKRRRLQPMHIRYQTAVELSSLRVGLGALSLLGFAVCAGHKRYADFCRAVCLL
jgi:hypothetical protein